MAFGVDDPSASVSMPTPSPAVQNGWFQGGNPQTNVPATAITVDWLNMVNGEINNAVTALGGTPSKSNVGQLGAALAAVKSSANPVLAGDATGSASNGTLALTLAASGVTAGTYNGLVIDGKGRITTATANPNITTTGTVSAGSVIVNGSSNLAGAWTSYTPTLTPTSGTLTAATATMRYLRLGKTVFMTLTVAITNAGTGSGGLLFTTPFTCPEAQVVAGRECSVGGKALTASLSTNGQGVIQFYDNTSPIYTGYSLTIGGVYEVS